MDRDSAIKQISAVRAVVGAGAWIAPRASGKLFGLDTGANPQAPYLGRLFGARDVALAYGTLSSQGEGQDRWLVAGLGCDLADAAAGLAAWRAGYLSTLSSVLVTAAALNGVALGLVALRGGGGSTAAPAAA
ncbi:MAG: hypothetical protein QOH76_1575 [Thermoleophilaceae bacterium]|jgi:hypothetical protein|nr:hypothetical protein [Thermoleophilaceae bacterium]